MSTLDRINYLRGVRDNLFADAEAIRTKATDEARDLSDEESAEIEAIRGRVERVLGELEPTVRDYEAMSASRELTAKVEGASAVRTAVYAGNGNDPLYGDKGEYSFVADLLRSKFGEDPDAALRIAHHRSQVGQAVRATATSDLDGTVLPVYESLLPEIQAGRPFANSLRSRPLTSKVVTVPKVGGALGMGVVAENAGASGTNFTTTADDYTAVKVSGYTDISIESLDWSTISDSDIIAALFRSFGTNVGYQVVRGAGGAGAILGVLEDDNLEEVSASSASTFKALLDKIAEAKAHVADTFKSPATHIAMSAMTWEKIANSTDTDGRPLLGYNYSAPSNVAGTAQTLSGLTVVVDPNFAQVPAATPTTTNDILVYRADQGYLYESNGGRPATIRLNEIIATNGGVRFLARGYVNFPGFQPRPEAAVVVRDVQLTY